LVSSDEAIKDSGLDMPGVDKDEVGVIWASGIGWAGCFYRGNNQSGA